MIASVKALRSRPTASMERINTLSRNQRPFYLNLFPFVPAADTLANFAVPQTIVRMSDQLRSPLLRFRRLSVLKDELPLKSHSLAEFRQHAGRFTFSVHAISTLLCHMVPGLTLIVGTSCNTSRAEFSINGNSSLTYPTVSTHGSPSTRLFI